VLFGALAEWLSVLRRIDSSKADPVLLPVAVEQCDGVAVGNTHHSAPRRLKFGGSLSIAAAAV